MNGSSVQRGRSRFRWLFATLALPTLSWSVSTWAQPASATSAPPAHLSTSASHPLSIIRFIDVSTNEWSRNTVLDLSDMYSKLDIISCSPADNPTNCRYANNNNQYSTGDGSQNKPIVRDYDKEHRNWLERLFVHKTIHIAEVVNISIKYPDLMQTVPLFAIDHDSARGTGDVFSTSISHNDVSSSFFRIGPNTRLSIHFHEDINNDGKNDAAAVIFQAVKTAVSIAAPTSSLLTTLSKSEINNASSAIDAAIGGALTRDVSEDYAAGKIFQSYDPQNQYVRIDGLVPATIVKGALENPENGTLSRDFKAERGQAYILASWLVTFTCPRPSYFSTANICHDNATGQFVTKDSLNTSPYILQYRAAPSGNPSTNEGSNGPNLYTNVLISNRVQAIRNGIISQINAYREIVLQSKLSSQFVIQDWVFSQPWYTTYISNSKNQKNENLLFCNSLLDALYKQGLNQFDSEVSLYEVLAATPSRGPTVGTDCASIITTTGPDADLRYRFYSLNADSNKPGIPTASIIHGQSGEVNVAFSRSSLDFVTGYTVISSPDGGEDQDAGTPKTTHYLVGLKRNVKYRFWVKAIAPNDSFFSSYSDPILIR